jgi:hypothetical protein
VVRQKQIKKHKERRNIMRKREFEIPENLTTFKQQLDYTHDNFEKEYGVLNQHEVSGAKQLVICGRWLNGSKKVCKEHEMGNWIPYFEKRFSYPEVRTAQRFMKVARQVDLEETPALACLGKTALYKLTAMAEKEDLANNLSDRGFDLKIDPKDKVAIEDLKGQLDEYIDFCESLSPSEPRNNKSDKGEKDTEKDNETKAKPNSTIMEKVNRSAASFIKIVDLVSKDKKALTSNQDELNKIFEAVYEKLAAFKNSKNK